MCYSGKCPWEDHMGDCRFPTIKEVRDKYRYPVCFLPESDEELEYLNEVTKEIKKIVREVEERK